MSLREQDIPCCSLGEINHSDIKEPATPPSTQDAAEPSHYDDENINSQPCITPSHNSSSCRPTRSVRKSTKRKPIEVTPVPAKKKKKFSKWDIENLLQNPKSPLVYELIDSSVWFELDDTEKREIVQLLPEIDRNEDQTNIKSIKDFFASNEVWRDTLTDWQRSLDAGLYQESWVASAEKAHKYITSGNCDRWKEDQFEQYWGQKQKLSYAVRAGEQTNLKMTTIAEMGYFKKGDLWLYARTFGGKGTRKVIVTKEITLHSVDTKGNLTFEAPRGKDVYLRAGQPSTRFSKISAPTMLETKILDEDGSVPKQERPNGNAWKNFRISRAGEDLGTLFEVRGKVFIKK